MKNILRTIYNTEISKTNNTNLQRFWWLIFIPYLGPQQLITLFMIDTLGTRKNYTISNLRMKMYFWSVVLFVAIINLFLTLWGVHLIVGETIPSLITFIILGLTPILLDRKYRIRKDTESQESGGKTPIETDGKESKNDGNKN